MSSHSNNTNNNSGGGGSINISTLLALVQMQQQQQQHTQQQALSQVQGQGQGQGDAFAEALYFLLQQQMQREEEQAQIRQRAQQQLIAQILVSQVLQNQPSLSPFAQGRQGQVATADPTHLSSPQSLPLEQRQVAIARAAIAGWTGQQPTQAGRIALSLDANTLDALHKAQEAQIQSRLLAAAGLGGGGVLDITSNGVLPPSLFQNTPQAATLSAINATENASASTTTTTSTLAATAAVGGASSSSCAAAASSLCSADKEQSALQHYPSSLYGKMKKGKSGRQPRPKKPKDMPKRPLSAYNIFFKDKRAQILASIPDAASAAVVAAKIHRQPDDATSTSSPAISTSSSTISKGSKKRKTPHRKIGFESLAKLIGTAWKNCPPAEVAKYKVLANEDMMRYKAEMDVYNEKKNKKKKDDDDDDNDDGKVEDDAGQYESFEKHAEAPSSNASVASAGSHPSQPLKKRKLSPDLVIDQSPRSPAAKAVDALSVLADSALSQR